MTSESARATAQQRRDDVAAAIQEIHDRLDAYYAGRLGSDHVARVVREASTIAGTARFTNYVPVLIEKAARDKLRAATRTTR